jgi:hypothetical protein
LADSETLRCNSSKARLTISSSGMLMHFTS